MSLRHVGQRGGHIQQTTEEHPVTDAVTVADSDFVKLAAGRVTNRSIAGVKLHGVVLGGSNDDLVSRNYRTPETTGDSTGTKKVLVELCEGERYELDVNGSLDANAVGRYYNLLDTGSALLTSDATAPSNNDTVTLGGVVYTYKTTLTGAANEVLIGASAAAALDNLKAAVNDAGGTEGTDYGTGTVVNPLVEATTNTNTTQLFETRDPNDNGSDIAVSESSTHLSFNNTTLAGGPGSQQVNNDSQSATVGQLYCVKRVPTNAAETVFRKGWFEVSAPQSATTPA